MSSPLSADRPGHDLDLRTFICGHSRPHYGCARRHHPPWSPSSPPSHRKHRAVLLRQRSAWRPHRPRDARADPDGSEISATPASRALSRSRACSAGRVVPAVTGARMISFIRCVSVLCRREDRHEMEVGLFGTCQKRILGSQGFDKEKARKRGRSSLVAQL